MHMFMKGCAFQIIICVKIWRKKIHFWCSKNIAQFICIYSRWMIAVHNYTYWIHLTFNDFSSDITQISAIASKQYVNCLKVACFCLFLLWIFIVNFFISNITTTFPVNCSNLKQFKCISTKCSVNNCLCCKLVLWTNWMCSIENLEHENVSTMWKISQHIYRIWRVISLFN